MQLWPLILVGFFLEAGSVGYVLLRRTRQIKPVSVKEKAVGLAAILVGVALILVGVIAV